MKSLDRLKYRFWAKVDLRGSTECWEWKAAKRGDGYGGFRVGSKVEYAHRVAWALTFGPIPDGMHVLHRCDNRLCMNPQHLFLGTIADNNADRDAKGRGAPPPRMKGERNPSSKLTRSEVLEIRALYPGLTQQALADKYGVCDGHICDIINRKKWKHV